jgi:hypothetical protein
MNDVVHGHCDAQFEKVADALAEEMASGEELGAAIAVDVDDDDELVVDIWGGHAHPAKTASIRSVLRPGQARPSIRLGDVSSSPAGPNQPAPQAVWRI